MAATHRADANAARGRSARRSCDAARRDHRHFHETTPWHTDNAVATRVQFRLGDVVPADVGSLLPGVISGSAIVSVVLSLPTTGPMLLESLRSQDMYLAGSFLMLLATLTVIGVLISDLALAALDPRIRLEGGITR